MDKREEIREGFTNQLLMRNLGKDRSWAEWETKMLFSYLHKEGVVIKGNQGMGYTKELDPEEKTYWITEPLLEE